MFTFIEKDNTYIRKKILRTFAITLSIIVGEMFSVTVLAISYSHIMMIRILEGKIVHKTLSNFHPTFPPSFISILFFSHVFNLPPSSTSITTLSIISTLALTPLLVRLDQKSSLPLPQVCSNPHRVAPTNRSARLGRRRDFTVLKTIPPRKFEQSVWWKDSTPLTNYFQSTGWVYVAEYTFSDCQFLSRRAVSFSFFLFFLIFSCATLFPFYDPFISRRRGCF